MRTSRKGATLTKCSAPADRDAVSPVHVLAHHRRRRASSSPARRPRDLTDQTRVIGDWPGPDGFTCPRSRGLRKLAVDAAGRGRRVPDGWCRTRRRRSRGGATASPSRRSSRTGARLRAKGEGGRFVEKGLSTTAERSVSPRGADRLRPPSAPPGSPRLRGLWQLRGEAGRQCRRRGSTLTHNNSGMGEHVVMLTGVTEPHGLAEPSGRRRCRRAGGSPGQDQVGWD